MERFHSSSSAPHSGTRAKRFSSGSTGLMQRPSTFSTKMSTPSGQASRSASSKPGASRSSTTAGAKLRRTCAHFSAPLVTATTRACRACSSWHTVAPIGPAAAATTAVSPAFGWHTSRTADQAMYPYRP